MPVVFVSIWAVTMETEMSAQTGPGSDCSSQLGISSQDSCWTGWSQSPHLFYLIAAPMLAAYAVSLTLFRVGFVEKQKYFQINLIFILNIVRILVSKLQADSTPNVAQVRRVGIFIIITIIDIDIKY